jgi:hypothetical protein
MLLDARRAGAYRELAEQPGKQTRAMPAKSAGTARRIINPSLP